MFRMLIDTCVWLDLAKDSKQVPVLGVVEELLRLIGKYLSRIRKFGQVIALPEGFET